MTIAIRIGAALAATLVLLAPALWNGFPLLQYDTGGYLARWWEGYLVPSRSVVYGLFVAAGWPLDFWPVIALQAAAAVWIVALVLRAHGFNGRSRSLLAVIAALALTTTLPWLTGILLTDIFAGLAVLALHLLLLQADRLSRREQAALTAFIAFAVASHSATFLLLLALAIAASVVSCLDRALLPRVAVARAACALTLGAAMLVGANYAIAKQFSWTPGGYGIVFARMLQDGIVARYLDRHCPDPKLRLCPYRHELPDSADAFLWDDGVFNRLGRFAGLNDEMRAIVLGSLLEDPAIQIETALKATAAQLVAVRTGEGVLPTIWHSYGIAERFTPSVLPALRAARQQRGELGFEAINAVHVPIALAAMALLPVIVLLGLRRRRFADLGWLAASVALAILANAFICGPLSNPHDRYGARLAWLAPLVVMLAIGRWREQMRPPGGPAGAGSDRERGKSRGRTGGRREGPAVSIDADFTR
jgi:hypothetical protein